MDISGKAAVVTGGASGLGLATANVRLPLSPAEPGTWSRVQTALADLQAARRTDRGAGTRTLPNHVTVPHDTAALAS